MRDLQLVSSLLYYYHHTCTETGRSSTRTIHIWSFVSLCCVALYKPSLRYSWITLRLQNLASSQSVDHTSLSSLPSISSHKAQTTVRYHLPTIHIIHPYVTVLAGSSPHHLPNNARLQPVGYRHNVRLYQELLRLHIVRGPWCTLLPHVHRRLEETRMLQRAA